MNVRCLTWCVLVSLATVVVAVGCGSGPTHAKTDASASSRSGMPRFGHVFLIVGENTSFAQITHSHAPYLTGTLKANAAWLTNYHSFKRSSSLGQYIALVSGQYTKCESTNDLPAHCHQSVPNLPAARLRRP